MNLSRTWGRLAAALAALLLLVCLGAPALAYQAIDTDRPASLTVYFGRDGRGFAGVPFRLYRVADVSEYARFTLCGSFARYPVAVNGLDSSGWRALAQTLDGYTARDGLAPLQSGRTGSDGRVRFSALTPGLYLVSGDPFRQDQYTYTPQPFLICLPSPAGEGGAWEYDIAAVCKYDRREHQSTVDRKVLKV